MIYKVLKVYFQRIYHLRRYIVIVSQMMEKELKERFVYFPVILNSKLGWQIYKGYHWYIQYNENKPENLKKQHTNERIHFVLYFFII